MYCSAGKIDMLSTEVFFLQKGTVYYSKQLTMQPRSQGLSSSRPSERGERVRLGGKMRDPGNEVFDNEVPGHRDIRTVIEKLLIGQENKSDVRCPHNVCLY